MKEFTQELIAKLQSEIQQLYESHAGSDDFDSNLAVEAAAREAQ